MIEFVAKQNAPGGRNYVVKAVARNVTIIATASSVLVGCSLLRRGGPSEGVRCGDSGGGKIECTITQSSVNQSLTEYQSIPIKPGVLLTVDAVGCNKTGGRGLTWKRYVDPQGPDSDRLYHGGIVLPADVVLPSGRRLSSEESVRIAAIRGVELEIPSHYRGGHLRLTYEDEPEAYSDNVYDNVDDGWGEQCKGQGPATVFITLRSGVPPTPTARHAPFDVVAGRTDANGFPLNPEWGYQRTNRDLKGRGYLPDANALCNGEPDRHGCTTARTSRNLFPAPLPFLCGGAGYDILFPGMTKIHGHVNWFPVTFEGSVAWDGLFLDWDQNFLMIPMNGSARSDAGLTTGNDSTIELEFDTQETLDAVPGLSSTFWQRLKDGNVQPKREMFRGVVSGLWNLDCVHNCKSELHPVYAMALLTHIDPAKQTDTWDIFVRTWGNQGECSDRTELLQLPVSELKLHLWRPDVRYDAEILPRVDFDSPTGRKTAATPASLPSPQGGATIEIPKLQSKDVLFGTLTFHWSPAPGGVHVLSPALISPPAIESADRKSPEERAHEMTKSLSGQERKVIRQRLDSDGNIPRPVIIDESKRGTAKIDTSTRLDRALCGLFGICAAGSR